MANKRLVIALGGNALGNTPEEQLELVSNTAAPIVDLIEEGFDVIVTHGNGPQVGMIKVATDNSATKVGGRRPSLTQLTLLSRIPPSPSALSSPRKRPPSSWRKLATSMLRMLVVAGAGLSLLPHRFASSSFL